MRGGKERCRLAHGRHSMLQSEHCRPIKRMCSGAVFIAVKKSLWYDYAGSPDGGALVGAVAKNVGAKRLVVAWWGDKDISILARSLAAFSPRGSRISVIAQDKPEVGLPWQPFKAGQSCPGHMPGS